MGQALYRKYRSKTFGEVVGQDHVTKTLENALKNQTFAHAYLLTGPRGVGKTSIARIMAHAVNDLPYDETTTHLDIIEIDAASNRRIDEIRDLRDKVHIVPTSAKYKVYIIDEVHMLTKEAFNALLKTLEEPPAHVIFILATTEVHKLPETIVSRTQHFRLRTISTNEVAKSLQTIANKEGVSITDSAATIIADYGNGSFRDSISLLDQLRSVTETIDEKTVQNALGIAPNEVVGSIWDEVTKGDPASLITRLESCYSNGYQAVQIARQLHELVRTKLVIHGTTPHELEIIKDLLYIPGSPQPESLLEVTLLRAQLHIGNTSDLLVSNKKYKVAEKIDEPKPSNDNTKQEIIETDEGISTNKPVAPETVKKSGLVKKPNTDSDNFIKTIWPEVLGEIKKQHNTLYSVARMAQPILADGTLILKFNFPFHYKRLSESKNSQVLLEIIQKITGKKLSLECELLSDNQEKSPEATNTNSHLESISNIFGGAEVLES